MQDPLNFADPAPEMTPGAWIEWDTTRLPNDYHVSKHLVGQPHAAADLVDAIEADELAAWTIKGTLHVYALNPTYDPDTIPLEGMPVAEKFIHSTAPIEVQG